MYSYETPKYFLPAQAVGDIIEGQEEQRQANIIDTQLYGVMRSNNRGHGVIATGTFTGHFDSDNSCVVVSEAKPKYAVEALINQTYVYSINPFQFDGLANNTKYYLYIRLIEQATGKSSVELGEFTTYASASAIAPSDGILIATATTTDTTITIDSNPVEMITIPILSDHVADNTDPHGVMLYQSWLTVVNSLVSSGVAQFNAMTSDIFSGNTAFISNLLSGTGTARFNSLFISGTTTIQGDVSVTGSLLFPNGITLHANVSVDSGIEVDGRDISADGTTLDSHITNYNNPHHTTAALVSGIDKYGDTLYGNLAVQSGKSIDGIDVSTLQFLIDGSDASGKHQHSELLPQSGLEWELRSPEYGNAVVSGIDVAVETLYDSTNSNIYNIVGNKAGGGESTAIIGIRVGVPMTVLAYPNDYLRLSNQIQSGTDNKITLFANDTANANIVLSNNVLKNITWTTDAISYSGSPAFTKGSLMSVFARVDVASGTFAQLGDLKIRKWEDYTGV
jgi:hypothetical protein